MFLAGLILLSCNNELDLYGSAEDRPVVWCLLNATDSIHYIRVQRSFIPADENALIAAATPGISDYQSHEIRVGVQEWLNEEPGRYWEAERVDGDSIELIKEEGLFASSPNILYRFKDTLRLNARYQLHIENLIEDSLHLAETGLVGPFPLYFPIDPAVPFNLSDTGRYTIDWLSASRSYLYDAFYEVQYQEEIAGLWHQRSARIPLFNNRIRLDDGGFELMRSQVRYEVFYTGLRSALTPAPPQSRRFVQLNLVLTAYGEEVYLLYLNNLSNLGISALFATGIYSNLSGGLGVFSSRGVSRSADILLTAETLDSLACGRFTRPLGFSRPDSLPGSPTCP